MNARTPLVACFCTVLLSVAPVIHGADGALTVAISEMAPCAILEDSTPTGFSVDLWEAIAEDLQLEFTYSVTDLAGKLEAAAAGSADVAIAGISVTRERERVVDFSFPTLESGLRAAVKKDNGLMPDFGTKSRRMLLFLLFLLLLFGHILWWAERGQDAIKDRYFPGIFEAFWCVFATMTTVGYGDIAPRKWLGRFMAVLIMLIGISFFSVLIATVTADFLKESEIADIKTHEDLHGLRVGAKIDTTGMSLLEEMGIKPVTYPTLDRALDALSSGEIDVLVYDEPTLLHLAARMDWLMPVGERFYDQYYAFAFPEGSALLEDVNQTLLKLRENGVYERIHMKWFRSSVLP